MFDVIVTGDLMFFIDALVLVHTAFPDLPSDWAVAGFYYCN